MPPAVKFFLAVNSVGLVLLGLGAASSLYLGGAPIPIFAYLAGFVAFSLIEIVLLARARTLVAFLRVPVYVAQLALGYVAIAGLFRLGWPGLLNAVLLAGAVWHLMAVRVFVASDEARAYLAPSTP